MCKKLVILADFQGINGVIKRGIAQGHLKIWTEDLKPFFLSWKPVGIWKNCTNIISGSLKDAHFSKVSRL